MAPNFTLGLDAAGQVLAVNEGLVDEVAATLLRAELPADQQIVGDEISVSRDPGVVAGNTISYIAAPTAMVYRAPDNAGLIDRVRGKTVLEARAILGQYGTVEITLWPEFIDRLPEQSARISLTVAPPAASR